ncbi:MAG: hypothetical protein M1836_005112 [Candelina mexicana]|nr:MAG: hypothetical protein M1836_005112 [Candelina mexicana]
MASPTSIKEASRLIFQQLTVYSYVGSQWAGVAHLGLAEKKFDKSEVEIKEIDLFSAENLDPAYLKINPNGTVPTLTASNLSQPLLDTRPILEYLDQSRPFINGPDLTPVSAQEKAAAHALIELVHSSDLETGLLLFGCLNHADIDRMKSSPLITYLAARQSALKMYLAADPMNAFYTAKLKDNSTLHDLFIDAPMADREAFFRDTAAGYEKFADGLEMLERQIRLPYAIGDYVTVADLHIVPWLSHALFALGTTDRSDFSKLETRIQQTVPGFRLGPKIRQWWINFGKRDSFQEVFNVLH